MSLELFHPVIQQWFRGRFAAPTEPQELGWRDLVAGRDVLVAAPTGSGKTLTAFLAAIDRLLRLAVRNELTDEIRVVYLFVEKRRMDALVRPFLTRNHSDEGVQVTFFNRLLCLAAAGLVERHAPQSGSAAGRDLGRGG